MAEYRSGLAIPYSCNVQTKELYLQIEIAIAILVATSVGGSKDVMTSRQHIGGI